MAIGSGSSTGWIGYFVINPAGGSTVLNTISPALFIDEVSNPRAVTTDPLGRFVYVANEADSNTTTASTISVYAINQATGALTAGTPVSAGFNPRSVAVDPSGRFLYAANLGVGAAPHGSVSVFRIDQDTGALTPGVPVAAGTHPLFVTTVGSVQ